MALIFLTFLLTSSVPTGALGKNDFCLGHEFSHKEAAFSRHISNVKTKNSSEWELAESCDLKES